jgi:hypothetical protein
MERTDELLRQVTPMDDNGFVELPEAKFVPILILRNEMGIIFQDTEGRYFKLAAHEWDGMDGEEATKEAQFNEPYRRMFGKLEEMGRRLTAMILNHTDVLDMNERGALATQVREVEVTAQALAGLLELWGLRFALKRRQEESDGD